MRVKELRRVHVIRQAMEQQITQVKAGTLLGLTARQIRRLMQRVRADGDAGPAHRGRGRPSNRWISETVKAKALRLYAQRYGDFGLTLVDSRKGSPMKTTVKSERRLPRSGPLSVSVDDESVTYAGSMAQDELGPGRAIRYSGLAEPVG